jgi:hypothetical protein
MSASKDQLRQCLTYWFMITRADSASGIFFTAGSSEARRLQKCLTSLCRSTSHRRPLKSPTEWKKSSHLRCRFDHSLDAIFSRNLNMLASAVRNPRLKKQKKKHLNLRMHRQRKKVTLPIQHIVLRFFLSCGYTDSSFLFQIFTVLSASVVISRVPEISNAALKMPRSPSTAPGRDLVRVL